MSEEILEYDVIIVGAGPAGLATSIRLAQQAKDNKQDISIALLEKGSEIGAHILSGAILDPSAINILYPDWLENVKDAVPVKQDKVMLLKKSWHIKIPNMFAASMQNHGNYIVSLGNVCRALASKAEELGVEIYPGFSVAELLYKDDRVIGVKTQDMGRTASGSEKSSFEPGIEMHAKITVLAEGCRGHLGKQVIKKYALDQNKETQHYGIGLKEIWRVKNEVHSPGTVIHTAGWPSTDNTVSGSFLYHADNNQVFLGYVVPLSYENPYTSPFEEFQKWKTHPSIKKILKDGERLTYGARALIKGGPQSRPKMVFAGGLLIGDDAGTLNFARIKGSHTAMHSGIIAGEIIAQALKSGQVNNDILEQYDEAFTNSIAGKELQKYRNFGTWLHKFGSILGPAFALLDCSIFKGKLPFTLSAPTPDHACTKPANQCKPIEYLKPDQVYTFDKLSSVFISNTNHAEDQPCHLQLADSSIPIEKNLPIYNEPAQLYCPAGVYEVQQADDGKSAPKFVINSQNCVHCKTCDIKDPAQNITWVTPEGAGGPNYPNM